MGKRHSKPKPPVYPPNDPFFVNIGCTGLRQSDYLTPRLESAPFLYFKFSVSTYEELLDTVITTISKISPNGANFQAGNIRPRDFTPQEFMRSQQAAAGAATGATSAGAAATASAVASSAQKGARAPPIYEINGPDERLVYGPIFIMSAYDFQEQLIEAYLYFPSMTKDMKPWNNYNVLGANHSWMYRILYNYQYRFIPYSSCSNHIGKRPPEDTINTLIKYKKSLDASVDMSKNPGVIKSVDDSYSYGFTQGCVTKDFDKNSCMQTDTVHRGMGIFKDGMNSGGYPAVYFTTYKINLKDKRIVDLINQNSFESIQRNILCEGTEMYSGCQYNLISPNQKYFLTLGNFSFVLYYNTDTTPANDLNESCFNKKSPKKAVPLNGKIFKTATCTKILVEDGRFNIYGIFDNDPDETESILFAINLTNDLSYPISVILTDDGNLLVYNTNNDLLKKIDIKKTFSGVNYSQLRRDGPYDPVEDYRQRLLNLMMYLQERGRYKDSSAAPGDDPTATGAAPTGSSIITNAPPPVYDSSQNYFGRLDNFLNTVRMESRGNNRKLRQIDIDAALYNPPPVDDSVDFSEDNVFSTGSLIEETPEQKAARLDKEATARKDKRDKDQAKRGDSEDNSFVTDIIPSGSNLVGRFGAAGAGTASATISHDQLNALYYEGGRYNNTDDMRIRTDQLNDYVRTNNANYRDTSAIFSATSAAPAAKSATVPSAPALPPYNYATDRSMRIKNFAEYS